jgi:hypothetical protein
MSKNAQTMTQNHSQPVKPTPGVYKIAYNRVAKGKKMMPSNGKRKVSKAASTRTGLRIQKRKSANRGKNPAISTNKQPMLHPPNFDSALRAAFPSRSCATSGKPKRDEPLEFGPAYDLKEE